VKISIFSIERSSKDAYKTIEDEFVKMSSKFADVKTVEIQDKNVQKAVKIGINEAKDSYSKAYEHHLKGFCIALDESGELMDSKSFSLLFDGMRSEINFFLGGAYGFDKLFLSKFDRVISLSPMTFGHKLARVALLEQVFRGLAIKNNHPYHK